MTDNLLEPRLVRMPELAVGKWLNTAHPLDKRQLLGQIVLVDFWDYTCVNCLRTLPYLREWHRRYSALGLAIIGIHSPEFRFGQLTNEVEAAIEEHDIRYPVLLDNAFQNWERFANKAWPTKYLVDSDGYLRFRRQGEGYYQETESAIQHLLKMRDPNVHLPSPLKPLRSEDSPGAVCFRSTPELFAGYRMGGLMGHALGNDEGYATEGPAFYTAPPQEGWHDGQFYLDGLWRAWPEAMAFAGHEMGRFGLTYRGASVNAVLSPSADSVEVQLGIQPSGPVPIIEVRQNGNFLTETNAGRDAAIQPDGRSIIVVTRARMYELARNATFEPHWLELTFTANGLALYSFSFTSCVVSGNPVASDLTITIH